jgi:vacuolar protein sorting-associated protein 35
MLKIPVDAYKNVLKVLQLKHYATLYEHLDYVGRKNICQYILSNVLEHETEVASQSEVESLLQLINPLLADPSDKPADYEQDAEDFMEEQTLVARSIHLMKTDNLDEQYLILSTIRKHFANSGKERIQYIMPPIVFRSYELAYRYKESAAVDEKWQKKVEKIFKFCFQTIDVLIKLELPAELAFRLYLQGSIALCEVNYENCENIAYEFISQVNL